MSEEEIKQKIKEFEEKLELPAESRAYMYVAVVTDATSAEQEDFGGKVAEYLQRDKEAWKRILYRALQHLYSKLMDGADIDVIYIKDKKQIEIRTKRSILGVYGDKIIFRRWKGGDPLDLPNVDEFRMKIITSKMPEKHAPYVVETLVLLFQCLSQTLYHKGCFSTTADYIHNLTQEEETQEETQQEQQ
jgi:hypothetical protein